MDREATAKAILDVASTHVPTTKEIGRTLVEVGAGVLAGAGLSDAEVMDVVAAALDSLNTLRAAEGPPS